MYLAIEMSGGFIVVGWTIVLNVHILQQSHCLSLQMHDKALI